jgi:hypothetical protein
LRCKNQTFGVHRHVCVGCLPVRIVCAVVVDPPSCAILGSVLDRACSACLHAFNQLTVFLMRMQDDLVLNQDNPAASPADHLARNSAELSDAFAEGRAAAFSASSPGLSKAKIVA